VLAITENIATGYITIYKYTTISYQRYKLKCWKW